MIPKIFINGRFLGQQVTGVQRYARETLAALVDLLRDQPPLPFSLELLAPHDTPEQPDLGLPLRRVGRLTGHAWEQLELPWYSRSGALFSFGFTGPLLKRRQVITIHDAAVYRVPQAYHPLFAAFYKTVVGVVSRRAPLTVAVSAHSAREAARWFGTPAQRVRVVTEGWQHLDRQQADLSVLDRLGLQPGGFILGVSSPTPNKNFALLVQALERLGAAAPTCVVVGAANQKVFQGGGAGPAGSAALRYAGYVSDEALKALYQSAQAFVFPSFYEGFGIPPLEAMSCGCPVLASTADAVRETCGEAALYFDPHHADELAALLTRLRQEPALAAELRRAGLARAAEFSWQRGAHLNLDVLKELSQT